MINILVVEDEKDINDLIEIYLVKEGYKVFKAFDGNEAISIFNKEAINLILLDVMIPGIDGFNVLRKVRETSEVPVIFLTARIEEKDKILGLGLGADDYVMKPFSPLEVLARVEANLRRYLKYKNINEKEDIENIEVIKFGNIKIDINGYCVYKDEKPIDLNTKEYKILELLSKNQGRVYTKKQLYEAIWEEPYYGDENTIMVHMSRLRDKIEDNPKSPKYIKTIRGIGYKLERGEV